MKLAHDAMNRYFEKSERMNLLQQRIKAYCTLLRDRYNDQGFRKTQDIPLLKRWELLRGEGSEIVLKDATLKFSCFINTNIQACSLACAFELIGVGKGFYDLSEENLPTQYIELVYESLPLLTDLMRESGDPLASTIAGQVTREILAYLT